MTITQYQNPILRVICTQNPGHIAINLCIFQIT